MRDQVIAAYAGYWQAYAAASRARSTAAATALLTPYATPAFVRSLIGPLPGLWQSGNMSYGYAVPHVLGVRLGKSSTLLHDCLDLSRFGAQNYRTGRVDPRTFGLGTVNFYVTLIRSGGRWVVSRFLRVEVPCAP